MQGPAGIDRIYLLGSSFSFFAGGATDLTKTLVLFPRVPYYKGLIFLI